MKRYLSICILSLGMMTLTTNATYAEEGSVDLGILLQELQKLTEELSDIDAPIQLDQDQADADSLDLSQDYNGMNEPVSVVVTTGTYDNEYDGETYESLEEFLKEARTETFEGTATLEITEVFRGEDVYEHVSDEPYEYLTDPLEGYEWALISFTYEWEESEDTRPLLMSRIDFRIYETDGTKVDNNSYYLAFEGGFDQVYTEVGQKLEETIIKLVPEDEPFILEYGDDIFFEKVYFELE